MKVLITTSSFGKHDPEPLEILKRAGLEIILNPHGRTLSEAEITDLLAEIEPVALIAGVESLTETVLTSASRLKVISRCGVGMDKVALAAAEDLGIKVYNTPDAPTQAVAELTLGLMLDVLRGISRADSELKQGKWAKKMGRLLADKIVGVIGLGRIGRRVAELVRAFGGNVIACDICPDKAWADERAIGLFDKDEILTRADIITLHAVCDQKNTPLIGQRELDMMKTGAYLINTARGELVDERALATVLNQSRLAGAALDTFTHEPYDGPLKDIDNIVLSPHVGSYALEARVRMESASAANAIAGLEQAGYLDGTDKNLPEGAKNK